ncbi:MAG: alpha/beta hydrolase [Acidobacteriota bacterium]
MIRKPCCYLPALFVLLTGACSATANRDRTQPVSIPAPSLRGSLFENDLEQPAVVCPPPSYESTTGAFPVIYYLPGFTTDVTEYIDRSIDGLHMGESMDRLIATGAAREAIIVIVNGRNFLGGSFYVNSPVTGNWEDFVVKDVVSYVDRTYRTIRAPSARGIAGDSMGGFGAVHTAMRHPEVFGAVYAISPALAAPGGLSKSPMLAPDKVEAYLLTEPELRRLSPDEGERELRELMDELYASHYRFHYYRAMVYAYGAAFAFDVHAPPAYIDFPFERTVAGIVETQESLRRFEVGFGDLDEKVRANEANLRRLRGIALDWGKNDRHRWIVEGCEHFAALLRAAGIAVEVRIHDGGHTDRLRESIESHALPFLSEHLASSSSGLTPTSAHGRMVPAADVSLREPQRKDERS